MLTIITIPEGWSNSVLGYVATITADLSTPITVILGVFLGLLVVEMIIGAMRKH